MTRIRILQGENRSEPDFNPHKSLVQNLFEREFFRQTAICSGLGLCGECRVRFFRIVPKPGDKDREFFSEQELEQGWRLACSHFPEAGAALEIPVEVSSEHFAWASEAEVSALGVDIGTTTLKWGFLHADEKLSLGTCLNPQMGAGSEIMSRLAYASRESAHFSLLQELMIKKIKSILLSVHEKEIPVVTAGNPAMIHILLGKDITGLLRHPYRLEVTGGKYYTLSGLDRQIFIPPLLSPFVGADISSGLGYLVHGQKPRFPFLFCDLGTNGEIVLGINKDEFYSTSVALGPALEGVGLRFGSPFGPKVASGFVLTPKGIEPKQKNWNSHVSGSGYLSLLSALSRLGIMDATGRFAVSRTPLSRTVDLRGNKVFIRDRFYLSGRDVEEILKVKAAFTLGIKLLLQKTSMSADRLAGIYLAGALGEHVELEDLDQLGFLPKGSMHKSRVLGNTSLKGALLTARERTVRNWVQALPDKVHSLALAGEPKYLSTEFFRHMRFEYV